MRRTTIFKILLASGIASYAVVTISSLLLGNNIQQNTWHMMGEMMSGVSASPSSNPYATLLSILNIIAIALASVGATGLLYATIKPDPQVVKSEPLPQSKILIAPENRQHEKSTPSTQLERINAALRVLKPDELKIINILREHEGKYLQKWITKDSGMSRLQTHRTLAKLSERKLVSLIKTGNTNEVTIAEWLREEYTPVGS